MSKPILGLDFGSGTLKMVVAHNGKILGSYVENMPDSLVKNGQITSYEAMAEFLKTAMRKNQITTTDVAISVSPAISYSKTVTLPKMTIEELKINLPYEFKDYIVQGKEKYNFDYAVIDINDSDMTLMACAALKIDIYDLKEMCRMANLKLVRVVPDEFAIKAILDNYADDQAVCVVDFGHEKTMVHMFNKHSFDTNRTIDIAGATIDETIAEIKNVDVHLARVQKENNTDEIIQHEKVRDIINRLSLDIMRAINFYNYGSDSQITKCYVCGGGSCPKGVIDELKETLDIPVENISECYSEYYKELNDLARKSCQFAYGATLS